MKCGLDDFLKHHTVDDLLKLPKVTLTGAGWKHERQAHKAREAKREKRRLEAEPEKQEEVIPKELLANVRPTRELILAVADILKRFVMIKDDRTYRLLAVWTLSTYVYECFDFMPIIWVTSPTRRSGKTRLLEVLAQLASRPSGIKINPTEAIIFTACDRGVTLILDEVEKLRGKDIDTHGAIMAVLNSGFQRGASVSRMRKNKDGEMVEATFNTYGPKIIAGIATVTDTIADRSLIIKMIRRVRATETLERFRLRKLVNELGRLVMDLKVWGKAKQKQVQEAYDAIDTEPDELKSADDRFLDIVEPLIAIALFADIENLNGSGRVYDELIGLLKDMSTNRNETSDATIAIAVDEIAKALGSESERFIPSGELLDLFHNRPGINWIKTTRGLAGFLGKLDLTPKPDAAGKRRGYRLTRKWVDDMCARYTDNGLEVSEASEGERDQEVTAEKPSVRNDDSDTNGN